MSGSPGIAAVLGCAVRPTLPGEPFLPAAEQGIAMPSSRLQMCCGWVPTFPMNRSQCWCQAGCAAVGMGWAGGLEKLVQSQCEPNCCISSGLVSTEPQRQCTCRAAGLEMTCPLHPYILLLNYKLELNSNHGCTFFSEQAQADFFTSGSSGTVKVKRYR